MKFRTSMYSNLFDQIFQSKEFEGSGGLMIEIVILIYIFFGFGVMCDKYLIPAMAKIKEKYFQLIDKKFIIKDTKYQKD